MSVCTFLAADCPLPEYHPARDYPLHIDLDRGVIDDGGAEDNFHLYPFRDVSAYTDKACGMKLEWRYTEGRALQLIAYIRRVLEQADCVQLWRVWLQDRYDFEERPKIFRASVPAAELTAADLQELEDAVIWEGADPRPRFYCLEIHKSNG